MKECFESLLKQASQIARVFVCIDGIDALRSDDGKRAHQLDWLPLNTGVKVNHIKLLNKKQSFTKNKNIFYLSLTFAFNK